MRPNEQIYMTWRPLLFDQLSLKTLQSPDYRRFIVDAAIVPGCRLLLQRHQRRPDWPFVETKFNPNTGHDLAPDKYNLVHTWLLGRGSEALDDHLRQLDRFEPFTPTERDELHEVFTLWISNMSRALMLIADRHQGRIPFRVNRDLLAVDAAGRSIAVDVATTGAGNLFALKGLISSPDPAAQTRALLMLRSATDWLQQNRFEVEQTAPPPGRGHGPRMLMQGVASCFAKKAQDPAARAEALHTAALFLTEVLDAHYDAKAGLFSEYVDPATGARSALLDPGHANELVGLGLGMIECLEKSALAATHQATIARARREFPPLLIKCTALGFNSQFPGIYKAVDNRTGVPINSDMPWWNLPETMRAAARVCAIAETDSIRLQCVEIIRLCHNAYFSQYPNPANRLFPYQTLDGKTGRVVDVVPAVPEGDPLYHANGAFLDMLEVLERITA